MKKFGSILLKQILAAKEFAAFKVSRSFKKGRSEKQAYAKGTIGLSQVSQSIKSDFGRIISRKERKALAKSQGVAFKAYYN